MNEEQRNYEITFILSPNLKEEEINSLEEEIKKAINNLNGVLKKQDRTEKKKFAYPIKKFEFGYYLSINFLLGPEKLQDLMPIFKHNESILRLMIASIEQPTVRQKEAPKKKKIKTESAKIKELTTSASAKITTDKKSAESKPKLEDIDKKLEEILGV